MGEFGSSSQQGKHAEVLESQGLKQAQELCKTQTCFNYFYFLCWQFPDSSSRALPGDVGLPQGWVSALLQREFLFIAILHVPSPHSSPAKPEMITGRQQNLGPWHWDGLKPASQEALQRMTLLVSVLPEALVAPAGGLPWLQPWILCTR